jgi:hypothetical protein
LKLEEAKAECERWLAYLKREEDKSLQIQRIAAARRGGEMTGDEAHRKLRAIDNCSVTVYDGANLEKAVRVLLKHCK